MSRGKEPGLIKKIMHGDVDAFEEAYEELHRQLFGLALRYLKDRGLAENAVQDVFVKLWEKRSSLDPDGSIKGLLFTMMKNHLLNQIRDEKRKIVARYELNEQTGPQANITEDDVLLSECREMIKKGLEEMPDSSKNVFKLKAFRGMTNQEVSEQLSISINTVKSHFYHSSKKIRSYLEKHADV